MNETLFRQADFYLPAQECCGFWGRGCQEVAFQEEMLRKDEK